MSNTKFLKQGSIVEFEKGFELMLLPVQGIDYERAPGGKVVAIKLPTEVEILLKIMSPNGSKMIHFNITKTSLQQTTEVGRHRFTFVSIEPDVSGYKVQIKIENIPLKILAVGEISNTLKAGDEIQGPENLLIVHEGYVNAHTMDTEKRSGTTSSCIIKVIMGSESYRLNVPAPLDKPLSLEWKNWIFTFTRTDPDGGTMPTQIPIEFKVMKKK